MQTMLIEDAAVRADDPEVLRILERCARSEPEGTRMRIGLRNEQGNFYRRIFTSGRAEFLATVAALSDAGFTEELRGGGWIGAGFHVVFAKGISSSGARATGLD